MPFIMGWAQELLGACTPEQGWPTGLGHLDALAVHLSIDVHVHVIAIRQEEVYFFHAGVRPTSSGPDFFLCAVIHGFFAHFFFCFFGKLLLSLPLAFVRWRLVFREGHALPGLFGLIVNLGCWGFHPAFAFRRRLPQSLRIGWWWLFRWPI
jgi:hypothetical protein